MDKLVSRDLSKVLNFSSRKRKVTLKDLHKTGIFLAEKLGDVSHLPMYFRIVKYEYPEFVAQAFSYAMASYATAKAPVFLKRLADIKQQSNLRIFIGIFPDKSGVNTLKVLLGGLPQGFGITKRCKMVPVEQLHLTLFFHSRFPATKYSWLVRLVGSMRSKYGDELVLTPSLISTKISNKLSYIWLEKFNSIVFRYYYGMFKLVREHKNMYKHLGEFLGKKKKSFYPHITLARCKNKLEQAKKESIDIAISAEFKLAVSKLTNKGPKYKIHATY